MPRMRVAQIAEANGPLEIVEREIPEPVAGFVRLKVEACGVCHSDSLTKEGTWPGIQYPRVPGHDIAGIIDAVGVGVAGWETGQRVGVGWHGGHCGRCDSCRRGDFVTCQIAFQIPGIAYDGGYAEYMIAPAGALAYPGRAFSRGRGTADVRGCHHLQLSSQQRRAARRDGRRIGGGGTRSFGRSVRFEDGFQDRRRCARNG